MHINANKKKGKFLLFSLNGVGRRHIVTGDVTFMSRVDGASLPPVTFTKETGHTDKSGYKTSTALKR